MVPIRREVVVRVVVRRPVRKIKKNLYQSRFLNQFLAEAGNRDDLPMPPTLIPVASIDPVEMRWW